MATGTNGIATGNDLNNLIYYSYPSISTRCPTKTEILANPQFTLKSSAPYYSPNQCVKYSDIQVSYTKTFTFYITEGIGGKAYTEYCRVYYTTNGGSSWTQAGSTSIGNTDGSKTVTVTATFPSYFLSSTNSTSYFIGFQCGGLSGKRDWKYRTNLDSTWSSFGSEATSFRVYHTGVAPGYIFNMVNSVYFHIYND